MTLENRPAAYLEVSSASGTLQRRTAVMRKCNDWLEWNANALLQCRRSTWKWGVRVFLYFLLYFGGFPLLCHGAAPPFCPLPVITFVCFSTVLLNFCCLFQFPMLASVVLFQPFLLIGFCFLGLTYDFKFVVSTQPVWVCLLALSRLPFKCLALYSYICKLILNLVPLPLQSPNLSFPDVSGSRVTYRLGCNYIFLHTAA